MRLDWREAIPGARRYQARAIFFAYFSIFAHRKQIWLIWRSAKWGIEDGSPTQVQAGFVDLILELTSKTEKLPPGMLDPCSRRLLAGW